MTVAIGQMTDDRIKQMLKALAAKAGLDYGEIVGAYAKRRTKIANDFLAVHHHKFENPRYWCGSNPLFEASIVDEDGKVIRCPERLQTSPAQTEPDRPSVLGPRSPR